jgi:DNA-binding CsgD family transcriptional regulator
MWICVDQEDLSLNIFGKKWQAGGNGAGQQMIRGVRVSNELLINEIYEAAVLPENWRGVLDRLAEIANAEGTLLFAAGPGVPRWISSDAIHDIMVEWTQSKWFLDNPRGQRLVPIPEPRFLTDLDGLTIEEIDTSDFYTELLRPRGLGWCVGTSIRSPSGDTLVLSIEKAHHQGPVPRAVAERLDELRPHLARAAVLSGRLGLERAKTAVATLEMIGLPAAAVTAVGRVISANTGFLASAPDIEIGAGNIVQFASESVRVLLMEAISNVANSQVGMGRSIPVGGTKSTPPFVIHVVPLRGAGLDLFTGALSIVFITPVVPNSSLSADLLQALFDLTPAEARVASLVANGKTIAGIAFADNSSENTIRTHLKSVFQKTGVRRQTELVSLIGVRKGQT